MPASLASSLSHSISLMVLNLLSRGQRSPWGPSDDTSHRGASALKCRSPLGLDLTSKSKAVEFEAGILFSAWSRRLGMLTGEPRGRAAGFSLFLSRLLAYSIKGLLKWKGPPRVSDTNLCSEVKSCVCSFNRTLADRRAQLSVRLRAWEAEAGRPGIQG